MGPTGSLPAPDLGGLVHDAVVRRGDDEVMEEVVRFAREGVAAGEPTLLTVGRRSQAAVIDALGPDAEGVILGALAYQDAYEAILTNSAICRDLCAGGTVRVRAIAPAAWAAESWHAWVRYEAAMTALLEGLPVWARCVYDGDGLAEDALADLAATHTCVHGLSDRPGASSHPLGYLAVRALGEVDALESRPPDIAIGDPLPGSARSAVAALGRAAGLGPARIVDLLIAALEVLANALEHGDRPVTLRGWSGAGRVVVTVHDGGSGPADLLAGLVPAAGGNRGLGLHLAHRLCDEVSLQHRADGFTARLLVRA